MTNASLIAALAFSTTPAFAQIYHHSFPDAGTTGMCCSTSINGNSARTSCGRRLIKEEQRIDKLKYQQRVSAGLKAAGRLKIMIK